MKIRLSFLLLHTSPLTSRQEKTRLLFWHDHSGKITEQAELQLDCWEWGCVLPSCGLRLLQKAAAATPFCTEQLPDSFRSIRSLAGKRFPWKKTLPNLTTQCLQFCFYFTDFWELMEGKALSCNSDAEGNSRP